MHDRQPAVVWWRARAARNPQVHLVYVRFSGARVDSRNDPVGGRKAGSGFRETESAREFSHRRLNRIRSVVRDVSRGDRAACWVLRNPDDAILAQVNAKPAITSGVLRHSVVDAVKHTQ